MEPIELPTPFAIVHILIDEKDLWAKDEIMEWIFHSCGLRTQKDYEDTMKKFNAAREELEKLSELGRGHGAEQTEDKG